MTHALTEKEGRETTALDKDLGQILDLKAQHSSDYTILLGCCQQAKTLLVVGNKGGKDLESHPLLAYAIKYEILQDLIKL